jgi:RNA polymerase sigma factor (sigma-70 family)
LAVHESLSVVSALPDAELVGAIEHAYRESYGRFLRLAVALLGDADQGRDAVQETFAHALRARADLRHLESVNGWLWRTLVNVCLAEKRRPVDRFDATGEREMNGYIDDLPEVRAAVAALPERQRLVLFLRHYADLDYQQIAEVVGIQRGTVAATLNSAHRKVRKELTEVQR